jgi:diguanylate cyclase (GGDEF)-like protein
MVTDIRENSRENAINTAERIRLEVCKSPIVFEKKEIPVSASFGVSFGAPVNDMETAIKQADEALYQAKGEGRNRVVFYQDFDFTDH